MESAMVASSEFLTGASVVYTIVILVIVARIIWLLCKREEGKREAEESEMMLNNDPTDFFRPIMIKPGIFQGEILFAGSEEVTEHLEQINSYRKSKLRGRCEASMLCLTGFVLTVIFLSYVALWAYFRFPSVNALGKQIIGAIEEWRSSNAHNATEVPTQETDGA